MKDNNKIRTGLLFCFYLKLLYLRFLPSQGGVRHPLGLRHHKKSVSEQIHHIYLTLVLPPTRLLSIKDEGWRHVKGGAVTDLMLGVLIGNYSVSLNAEYLL